MKRLLNHLKLKEFTRLMSSFPKDYDETASNKRQDIIAQNGNNGKHYDDECNLGLFKPSRHKITDFNIKTMIVKCPTDKTKFKKYKKI